MTREERTVSNPDGTCCDIPGSKLQGTSQDDISRQDKYDTPRNEGRIAEYLGRGKSRSEERDDGRDGDFEHVAEHVVSS